MTRLLVRLLLLYWCIPWFPAAGQKGDELQLFDTTEPRSKIMMINGNMYFHAGYNKNISFVSQGSGSIWLGDTDISNLPSIADVEFLKDKVLTMSEIVLVMKTRLDLATRSLLGIGNFSKAIIAVTRNISADVKMLREWKKDRQVKDIRLRRHLNKITKGIKLLLDAVKIDACESKPCQGGATCIPRIGQIFYCLCPPHRTGPRCENDVDECALYEGEAACQNNGTCENIANGFLCHCPEGYHGPLCQHTRASCNRFPDICGHGHCIENIGDASSDYRCICEQGYKPTEDKANPVCVDIDECEAGPCHPGVDCINLPGSFQCSGCPKGFFGNGIQCADIDECSQPEYPCSTNPRAPCINTFGSYHCGACPPGYRGDGKSCKRFSACAHRPCYPAANCTDDFDNMNAGGFSCQCPEGFLGDGIGPNGCKQGNSTICRAEGRCLNGGSCIAVTEDSYHCNCPEGYFGSRCEKVSECISTPCKNGATCQYDVTNGYSCICPPGFYGHDCEEQENACDQHFTSREGNFTFPDSIGELSQEQQQQCDLVISPQANNEALRITFTQFGNMETLVSGPTDCRTTSGNLSLFDGDNDNGNVFGVFCGALSSPRAPLMDTPITMTGSRALLRFKGTKGLYAVKWELKKRDCGYRTSLPSGSLAVPMHYQNISCEWFISAPMDKAIELTIPPLKLASIERNCSINQLEVYDGYTAYDAHRVIHFCASINETITVKSTGPFMSVFFQNDLLWSSIEGAMFTGFRLSYKFVEPENQCGATIVNTDGDFEFGGEITSPNWGGLYPNDMHCVWKIDGINDDNVTGVASQSLKLEFDDFDVVSPFVFQFGRLTLTSFGYSPMSRIRGRRPLFRSLTKCTQDYVHVYSDGNLVLDACNSQKPPASLLIPEGRAMIQFRSDAKTQGKGFKMKYSLTCEKRFRGNGTIQTWNYPDGGVKGKCTYIISADPTAAIHIKLKTIALKVASVKECFFRKEIPENTEDYVEFSGGREDNKQLNQKYICSKYPFVQDGEFITSALKPLTIEFSSSGHAENKGMLIEYYTIDVGCGGFFFSSTGIISSPSYPDKYLAHMHCTYYISVPYQKLVRLTFDNFDLEVVQNDDCNYDRVEIYESYISESDHGKLIGKFCGSMLPPTIMSGTNKLVVVFVSDRSIAGAGFSARFDSVDGSVHCDQSFTAPAGNIYFDGSKGKFTACNYHIALPFNSKILLKVENMTLPCQKGRLQIRNGADSTSPGFPSLWGESEICDDHPLQTTIRTHANRAYLKLLLLDGTGVSYNISYEQISSNCGGRVYGVAGSIAAPQYPQKDSRPMDCEWIVAVAPGNRLNFQLALVDDLKSSDENGFCGVFASNRLDVLDSPHYGSKIIRRYCRKILAAESVESNDHEILVRYRQQGGVQFGALFGFLAHFTTDCRDIEHTSLTGTIQSPGYPDPVYTNRFCKWIIRVPQGNRIKITFHRFDIDQIVSYSYRKDSGCNQNWLKFDDDEVAQATVTLASGQTNITNQLTETCEKIKPLTLTTKSNVLHVTFQSRQKANNKFWLTWTTIGCGGDVKLPSNVTVNKKNFGENISMAECLWKIEAPVGKKIEFRVNKFLIFKNTQPNAQKWCYWEEPSFTGIETFAGLSNVSGIVQDEYCSATKDGSVVFRSHSNEMFVRMKWQTSIVQTESNGDFFDATINFIDTNPGDLDDCGGVIEVPVGGNKTIHSPRFPEEYPRDAHCQWIFKAPPGHHLNYYLKEFITPNSHPLHENKIFTYSINNLTCQHPMQLIEGALTIYEGNNTKSRTVERFCMDIKEPKTIEVDTNSSLVTFQGAAAPKIHVSGEAEKKRIGFVMDVESNCGSMEYATSEEQVIRMYDIPKTVCNITVRKKNPDDTGVFIRLDEYHLRTAISKYHVAGMPRDYLSDEIFITIDGGEPIRRSIDLFALRALRNLFTHEEFRGEHEIKITIQKRSSLLTVQIAIAYSTDIESCGTVLEGKSGLVNTPRLVEDMECIWTLDNNPGNRVTFNVANLYLPDSENCAESYVEVRKYNDSGPLVERFCTGIIHSFTEEALWIKFRFVKPDQTEEEVDEVLDESTGNPRQYGLKFRYQQLGGGTQAVPGTIMQPKVHLGNSLEYKIRGEEGKGLVFYIDQINFPEYIPTSNVYLPSGLYFIDHSVGFFSIVNKMREMANSGAKHALTGWNPPKQIYIPHHEVVIYAIGVVDTMYTYSFHWDTIELEDIPNENATATISAEKKYDCGGKLTPTWEWQTLMSPEPPTEASLRTDGGYPTDTHCKWHMTRPHLAGIEVKIVKMDLEDVHNCLFDYVAIVTTQDEQTEEDDLDVSHKFCRNSQENETYSYTFNKRINIHFVSDRNRGGSGFIIQYKLGCSSFDFIKKEHGVYSATLISPGYPNAGLAESCGWAVVLESNRRIAVTIEDIQLADTECQDSFLSMVEHGSMTAFYNPNKPKYCGRPDEAKNITLKHGRLFMKYFDKEKKSKGFKLQINEVLEECTADELFVDEITPNRTFFSPLYPQLLPNSLDCEYVMRAPSGHRLQFTVDSTQFRLEAHVENGNCLCDSCDYIEIRDGATEHSPLIGRYCDTVAPSSITSTGNFLFVKLKTDSTAQSGAFKAEIKIATCGGTVVLTQNKTFLLQSPNYPDAYPVSTECVWTVYSPNTHFIESTLNHMWVSWTTNCTSDRLATFDGNLTAPYLMGPLCSSARLQALDYRTSSSMMTVQFVANSSLPKATRAFCKDKKCGFELALKVSKEGCGGLIDDQRGTITAPGYPDSLLPHVNCRWDLRAGAGYRYRLEFEFADPKRNGFYQQRYDTTGHMKRRGCYMDLQFFNGRYREDRPAVLGLRYFCENETIYTSEADIATIMYNDLSTREHQRYTPGAEDDRYYVPFRLNYTRVPTQVDDNGCTFQITTNTTMAMGNFKNATSIMADIHYCHLALIRPEGYGTTVIKIHDYSDEQSSYPRDCTEWGSYIEFDSEDDVRSINERICNATFNTKQIKELRRVYINNQIDIHVRTFLSGWNTIGGQQFNITIEYHACGGVVEEPNFGVLTSTNFGQGKYLPNEDCVWQLKAPEGMVVWINITNFHVEQHLMCEADVLIIGEGRDDVIIHRHCNPEAQFENQTALNTMGERHRSFRSHSRYLTLTWHSNEDIEFEGWRIEYEFVDEGEGCGFTTHALTGVVHSPKFPKDYPNDEECIWDIQVPVGFHVSLMFTHFDIEASEGCVSDFVQISEEHSARANEPLGEYFFLFEDEEKKPPMCGIVTPPLVDVTSNRMRINFTSNSRVNAKGFRAEWSAVCGAVYRLSHYEVVSPYYPNEYPNKDMECMYVITPEAELENAVVVFKIHDFDLSPVKIQYGRYPCESDYVEVLDLTNKRTLQVFCGGEEFTEEPIAVKGDVGIRMVANYTFVYGNGPKKHRGFSASYAIKKCGGTVNMMEEQEFVYPISSPAFPLEYPHDLDCTWNITTTGDRVFSIKFLKMEIEHTPECDLDWVELHDGSEFTNTSKLGTYCGEAKDMPKHPIRTQGNQMLVRFVSDSSMARGGFKMVVTATLGSKHGCGGKLNAKSEWSTLNPPIQNDGTYYHNLLCGWTIAGPENTIIEFKLEMLQTEKLETLPGRRRTSYECVDELMIYDGYRAFSPLLVDNLCTETVKFLPLFFHSSHRVAHVSFESDADGNGNGFSLLYRAAKPDCGEWVTAQGLNQKIWFTALLQKDAKEGQKLQRCQWVIQSKEQIPIELIIKNINVTSPDKDCSDAFIEIRDVGSVAKCQHPACAQHENDKKTLRYCGEIPFIKHISNTMALQITTSSLIQASATSSFTMEYHLLPGCNRTINATEIMSGRITSPNYPNPYDLNSTCTTTLQSERGLVVMVAFRQFRLEQGRPLFYAPLNKTKLSMSARRLTYRIPRCDHDYVQIYEGSLTNDTRMYCGGALPPTFWTLTNLSITLQSDYSVNTEGYDATYFAGRFNAVARMYVFAANYDVSGVITSMGYPNGYNDSTTQKWAIEPPNGHSCVFDVVVLSLAVGPNDETCAQQEEYLLIQHKDGDSSKGIVSQKVRSCSHSAPMKFTVEPGIGRRLAFHMVSDAVSSNNGVGFRVTWDCHVENIMS